MSGIVGGAGSKSGVIGETELDYEEGIYTWTLTDGSCTWNTVTNYTKLHYVKIFVIFIYPNYTKFSFFVKSLLDFEVSF